jgi:hypothetical protein
MVAPRIPNKPEERETGKGTQKMKTKTENRMTENTRQEAMGGNRE